MKKLVLVAAALGALALTATASAKEVKSIAVCGPGGCVDVKRGDMHAYLEGTTPVAAPPVSTYYTVKAVVEGDGETVSWTSYYVPSANVVAGVDERSQTVSWIEMPVRSRTLFADATAGLEPFPRPRINAALVDGRRVEGDASTYARLLTLPAEFAQYPADWDWVGIDLRSTHPSPWTASDRDLVYSPSANLLERGTERVPVPAALAADVEAARALGSPDSFPWPTLVLAVAGCLAAATLLALAVRRRPPRVSPRARLEVP